MCLVLFAVSGVADHRAQALGVDDLNVFALHFQDAVVLEAREQPADCLQCETEIAADLLAGHA